MSAGTSAHRVRSALAANPVLMGFAAIYVSIVAFSFAAVWTLDSRLPIEASALTSYCLESELIALAMYLVWIALPRPHRMRYALEVVLPLGLCLYGVDAAMLAATLLLNLDSAVFRMPFGSLPGLALTLCGSLAGVVLGRYLSALAASNRLRREAASSRRSAWFAETSPDTSWRRATGITHGLLMLPFILLAQATSPAFAPGSPLLVQLLLVAGWAFAVVVGDHATISISNTAVKVRTRLLSNNAGWNVSLSEIESAHAIVARPAPLTFDRSRIVLRTGPALEIRTMSGSHYTVSLDGAEEAVAVIESLRSGAPRTGEGAASLNPGPPPTLPVGWVGP